MQAPSATHWWMCTVDAWTDLSLAQLDAAIELQQNQTELITGFCQFCYSTPDFELNSTFVSSIKMKVCKIQFEMIEYTTTTVSEDC